jgi:hypothetical protein
MYLSKPSPYYYSISFVFFIQGDHPIDFSYSGRCDEFNVIT